MNDASELLAASMAAKKLGVTRRTLGRWLRRAELNFPKPCEINKRLYFSINEIETWLHERARRSCAEATK